MIGLILSLTSRADTLKIASVAAPAINCLFSTNCLISPEKEWAEDFVWLYNSGTGRLQSRVWLGRAGTPAAGLYAYLYRVDLASMSGESGCVSTMSVPAPSSAVPMDFNADGTNEHVFVITQGGVGSIAPLSALADSGKIWISFGSTFMSMTGVCPGESSFWVGFVSTKPPALAKANLELLAVEPWVAVSAYAPGALVFGFPTKPVGVVEMISLSNLLSILNLPAQGGGFEVDLGESQGWQNAFSDMQVGRSQEYAITMTGRGILGGATGPEPFSGTASLWVSNGLLYTSADFSRAGISTLVLEYRSGDGSLVGVQEIPTEPLPQGCPLPLCEPGTTNIPMVCSNEFLALNGEPAACWTVCRDLCTIDPYCQLAAHEPIKTICLLGKSPLVGPVQAITNVSLLLAGLDSVSSSAQLLRSTSGWHKAEGEVLLRGTRLGVECRTASIADRCGMTSASFPANVISYGLGQWLPWWSNFFSVPIEIDLNVLGTTSAGLEQQLATIAFSQTRGGVAFSADFNPLGSTSFDAVVYQGRGEVGRYAQPRSISVSEGPEQFTFARPGFTTYVPPNPIILLNWSSPVTFRADGEADLTGDTILLMPRQPTAKVQFADAITMQVRGISGFPLAGFHALPTVQSRFQDFSLRNGFMDWRSDTLPGASYFFEMTQDLSGSPSWQTLDQFVGNGFSRSFRWPIARGSQGFFRLRLE